MTWTRGPALLEPDDPALAPSAVLGDVASLLRAYAERHEADDPTEVPQVGLALGMARFAEQQPDALARANAMGHFTGSACVVDADGDRTLLLFHRKLQRWLQPGGHGDGNANLVAVALKEATEETGIDGLRIDPEPIDVDVHVIPQAHPGAAGSHLHLDVRFLVVAPAGAVEAGNHESEALRWVEPGELEDPALGLDAGTVRLLRAGFARSALRRS